MDDELRLSPEVGSVAAGRAFVREALVAWQLDDLIDTATLLTSEVVTNSVLHARTEIVLSVRRTGDSTVSISVHDGSPQLPTARRHSVAALTGRGMELLDQLSDEWHLDAEPDGKTLTFSVGAAADPWKDFSNLNWEEDADR